MNKKSFIALLVTMMLIVSSVATVSAAVFPDITSNHSWAEEAIEDMVSRGILKGYTDGTFKPNRAVTHLETLIIASRIMGVDEEENAEYRQAAVKKYSDLLSSYNIDYKDEVAYLLYRDVLKKNDLTSYISDSTKDQPLKRYEAAVLLTKLVGGEEEALNSSVIVLDFDDASTIPSSAKAYVKYIYDIGLMNGVDESNFNATGELTRAMIATIMYRAENYMDAYVLTGTVESVDSDYIYVTIDGDEEEIEILDNTVIKVDAEVVNASDISVNQVVRIHYQGDDVRFIDAVSSNLYYTVSGTISSMSESGGTKKITIKNSSGSKTYPISSVSCSYVVDNTITTYANINTNTYATLTIQAGSITKVEVETGSKSVKGTVSGITINSDVCAITILTSNGTKVDYVLNDGATVTRNSEKTTINSVAIGDSVTATIVNGGIEKLVATSSSKSVSGTISKIVISTNSTITIKTSTDEVEYGVTSDTSFVVDGKSDCTIYDLRLGATAEARLDSTNIASITTQSAVAAPTMTGVITYVHPTSYVMGLQVTDPATGEIKTIQTVVKSNAKVTDTTSSRVTTFKALEPGMTVVVVGSSSYGVYEVNQIIVTATVQ